MQRNTVLHWLDLSEDFLRYKFKDLFTVHTKVMLKYPTVVHTNNYYFHKITACGGVYNIPTLLVGLDVALCAPNSLYFPYRTMNKK